MSSLRGRLQALESGGALRLRNDFFFSAPRLKRDTLGGVPNLNDLLAPTYAVFLLPTAEEPIRVPISHRVGPGRWSSLLALGLNAPRPSHRSLRPHVCPLWSPLCRGGSLGGMESSSCRTSASLPSARRS